MRDEVHIGRRDESTSFLVETSNRNKLLPSNIVSFSSSAFAISIKDMKDKQERVLKPTRAISAEISALSFSLALHT